MVSHAIKTMLIGTCIFWGIGILLIPLSLCFGKHGGMVRSLAITSTFSMWLLWLLMFIGQINPLIFPQKPEKEAPCTVQ